MYLKRIKILLIVSIVSTSSLFLSSTTYASLSCSSLLTKSESLNPLEVIQEEIEVAKTPEEVKTLTYELVALGNRYFDNVIDGITSLNTIDPQLVQDRTTQIQSVVEALQRTFKIPSYVMNFAIKNRLEIEDTESARVISEERNRKAIGFARDEPAQAFHADQQTSEQMGFVIKSTNKEEKSFKNSFFRVLIANMNAKPEREEEGSNSKKAPIGFMTPKEIPATEGDATLNQIGFVSSKKNEESTDGTPGIHIVLNIQVGEFRVVEKKHKTGF